MEEGLKTRSSFYDTRKSSKTFLSRDSEKRFYVSNFPNLFIDVEKNKLKRIKNGKIRIEGTIDLHGLALKEAEKQLQIFIDKSFQNKKRLLLIITGKGKNSKPDIFGNTRTIKSEINKWISDSFYTDKVQYISHALEKHGGSGAFYFFLRNSKNIFP